APLQQRPQLIVRAVPQIHESRTLETGARLPFVIAAPHDDGRDIPGTNFLADVASVRMPAHRDAMFFRNRAFQLDCEIREASGGVEHTCLKNRSRRTRLQASGARTALIKCRSIRRERQAANDLGEKDPGTKLFVDEAGVLSDPPETGVLRVNALLHRPCIDVRASLELFIRDL